MNQNTLQKNQNNQNKPTFTEFSNLQSTVIQPGRSSNINYNDENVNSSDNIFPSFYTNTDNSEQQPTSNEHIASTPTPISSSYTPQYVGPQQPIENIPSPLGSFNMTTIHPSQPEIFSFDIPGFKIIVIPTFSQQDNNHLNYSSNITNTQYQ
ncbi:uncharacterized protein OCT59_013255 [Rhizophagus irregularis]|uniref:Uncharacterized protein n=2 Tax=Rhizophagus irregularis TaxID=588596 RepID=U9UK84_RHIID|nr:hypothetical protein GLOIN_2v1841631 [Rhizophagus irregularis DAOM 181602=DAOM 197198]EXX57410.1 hypothetical protein RirG_207440 [Rhizophagus irregularis DAOM 197198w]UZO20843.1 hypothetical protein OCT59_013255 [Rhizophagus irregularis]POG70461.1 hypothetical protein GLOIN_2v1841631 [Rhizophagus irregularis DAOM 181602=DAOM 197198]CAG8700667.1 11596_t:CDS:1 [Rhizophagus irregularis]GBC27679.1 hypothetical protein GLOIN_2v1841631 [Rhizophagus irregularis DAOM 181602=DAOM 197198]|eukprot:XP_025177327.1 hypothetical protein GLOIN_2v1841631 [Rhizophagus irregularis DAOM 181602=DAOM 197198]